MMSSCPVAALTGDGSSFTHYRGYVGIIENEMETTIYYIGVIGFT